MSAAELPMATVSEMLAEAVRHHQTGRLKLAEQMYRKVLEADQLNYQAWHLLGVVGHQQGDLARAAECMEWSLRLNPNYADAHYNLANTLKASGKLEGAIDHYRQYLALAPAHAEAHNSLGTALQLQGRLDEAIPCYRRAAELNPKLVDAHNNFGYALQSQGRLAEALEAYDAALTIQPEHALAHANRALVWLAQGEWDRGWPEFEWRWRTRELPPRGFAKPQWEGEPLAAKTILLHAEQGLGDTIQFVRYARLVKDRGAATVIVECQPELVRLLARVSGIDRLIPRTADLPEFDFHAPLMSLPGIFKTLTETVPASIPYLYPELNRRDGWTERLSAPGEFKIGIVWQGNPSYIHDRSRSVPLQQFAPLAEVPGVRLISLQKRSAIERQPEIRFPITNLGPELDTDSPFVDTAAVMTLLDLVISIDAAPMHLAGALGIPTWLALSTVPSWRWLLKRVNSPWYPTLHIFRQPEPGNWTAVFEAMKNALTQIVGKTKSGPR